MDAIFWWCTLSALLSVALSVAALILAYARFRAPSTLKRLASELQLEMVDLRAVVDRIEGGWKKFRAGETMKAYRDQGVAASSAQASEKRASRQAQSGGSAVRSPSRDEARQAVREKLHGMGMPQNPGSWAAWIRDNMSKTETR